MSRTSLYCLPVVWFTFFCSAQGGVIERDWKIAGDGLLTYDDMNQREWLYLSESLLEQFPGMMPIEKLQNAIAELGPGGLFEGFIFAKNDNAVGLAQSAGIDTTTFDFARNATPTAALIQLLSPTVTFTHSNNRLLTIGFLDELDNSNEALATFFVSPQSGPNGDAGIIIGGTDFGLPSYLGLMLYRNAIPEPEALVLGIQLLLMAFTMRNRK